MKERGRPGEWHVSTARADRPIGTRGRNFSLNVKELYGKIAIKVKELLKKFDHMSFTSDIWSDPSSIASLLSLTCHGIASDFEQSSIILKCETFDDRHTSDIIAEKIDTMLSEWNISNDQVHCMIRDGGSNMKRAMRLAKLQDLDCAVHKMQLAIRSSLNSQENIKGIKQKCKKISTHFNHSTLAQKQLHKIQDKLNQPHLKVFQDCVTRWNSTYYMLERFLKAKDALNLYINDSEIDPILPKEWKIIECCVELLKPFVEATRELSSSHTLISSVIPIIRMLTQKKIFDFVGRRNSYIIATYLDPRYKNKFFTSLTEEKIKDDILKISRNTEDILASRTIFPSTERAKKMRMTDSMDMDSERPGTSGTGRQSCLISDLAMILDSSSDDESQKTEINNPDVILKKELLTFRNKKRINLNECPLKWWSVNQSKYKLLSKMARKFLSAPPASVPKNESSGNPLLLHRHYFSALHPTLLSITLFLYSSPPTSPPSVQSSLTSNILLLPEAGNTQHSRIVNGLAAAAGCQLVATCDMLVCSNNSSFSTPGASFGIFCSTPGIAVGRSVPKSRALFMLLTGDTISAQEAYDSGLATKVVPPEDLDAEINKIIEKIKLKSRSVIAIGKEFYYKQMELNLIDAYKLGEQIMVENVNMNDGQEGIQSFIEKRKAKWSHN
ncbi:Enoyl-CoA hydratase domain-containing protein 3, mitochondrial [Eumeta japonica]|uniref:Enoyl-CoA hydratase domain-containing protein 3, mitochondrial n=1 Tax=Eumeta variegata TaxID=151549 RepID=A0A4C1YP39_EUMVA|nr:Enoyl-CoA hydratase domain-containing protein 3, mitochondrial [Eumeta japonica]